MSNDEFTFESVTERFASATAALDTLHQHLAAIAAAQEHQATMSEAIGEAAEQLREMVSTLVSTTGTVQGTLVDLREALAAAAEFLQGSRVEALRHEVMSLQQGVASARASATADAESLRVAVGRVSDNLAEELQQIREERNTARVELANAGDRLERLEAKIEAIPKRARQKFDL
jgi:chromosome segregation ATPase